MLADVEDRDHVRLARQPRGRQRLPREPLAHLVLAREALGEELHRDVAAEHLVERPEDLAHAAAADELGVAVARRKDVDPDGHDPGPVAAARGRKTPARGDVRVP